MFSQPQPEPPSDQTFESNYDDDLSRTFKGMDVNTWQDAKMIFISTWTIMQL